MTAPFSVIGIGRRLFGLNVGAVEDTNGQELYRHKNFLDQSREAGKCAEKPSPKAAWLGASTVVAALKRLAPL
jgi:hypothetical protein